MALSVTYPTDLIRRRLQLQGYDKSVPVYNNSLDCIRKIYKNEGGIPAFYRGLHANYAKSFAHWSIYFYIINNFNARVKIKMKENLVEKKAKSAKQILSHDI